MVSKKILGVAIAAALSSSAAFADFDLSTPTTLNVAKSSLLSASKVTIASPATATQAAPGDYYEITNGAALDIDVTGKVGIGLAADQKIYVRVDLTNAAFATTIAETNLTMDDSSGAFAVAQADTVSQGGAIKDKYVVFTVSPTGGAKFEVASDFALALPKLLTTGSGDVGVKVTFYSSIDNAINAASPISTATTTSDKPLVKFVEGVKATYTPSTLTADSDTLFKKFLGVAYGTKAEVGNVVVAVDGTVAAANGTTLSLDEAFDIAADKSLVTITGDFSNADYSLHTAGCGGAVVKQITLWNSTPASITNNTTGKLNAEYKVALGTGGLGVAAADTTKTVTLCAAKQDNSLVLSPTEFKAGIAYDKASGGVWAATAVPATLLGTVVRNGTTIQVPYLTTFTDYAQRLVLVNRGSADAQYSISFTPEAGVTAVAGTAASGSLAAGKTTIIPVTDIVTLTGKTRTAATITVVAADSKIDAATTSVNVSDKSTDTVKLK